MVKVKAITQPYFTIELQGFARHLSGNEDWRREERALVLTSRDVSSLVVDRL